MGLGNGIPCHRSTLKQLCFHRRRAMCDIHAAVMGVAASTPCLTEPLICRATLHPSYPVPSVEKIRR